MGELPGSDPFVSIREGLKGEPGLERVGGGTLVVCRELELDSFRTVGLLFTLTLGRKEEGEGEGVGECFVGVGGLDLVPVFKSSLAVTCVERWTPRRRMSSNVLTFLRGTSMDDIHSHSTSRVD